MSNRLFCFVVLFLALLSAETARGQQPGGSAPATSASAIRESRRQMDEYDRELERLRKGATVSNERRLNLFPQINDDFQRIQVIHNDLVRMMNSDKSLNYSRIIDLTGELKKRTTRLRTNLALPDPEDDTNAAAETATIDDNSVRASVIQLHDVVVSFVGNPIFKNLALLDAKVVDKASNDLRHIVRLSEHIKKSAETLNKTGKK